LCFKSFSRKPERERRDKKRETNQEREEGGKRRGREGKERFARGEREEREIRSLPLANIISDTEIRGMGERLAPPSAPYRLAGEK
jgi:hypothetical protein